MTLACFKAYDVRGRLGSTLDVEIVHRIGQAYSTLMTPGSVVVGHDARASSPILKTGLIDGLRGRGTAVIDIGQCGTEEVYFSVGHMGAGGGIMVTASHNPIDYNGLKFVGPGSRPIDPISELAEIARLVGTLDASVRFLPGKLTRLDVRSAYAEHVARMVDASKISGLKVIANAGNGTAGAAFDAILDVLACKGASIEVIRLHFAPDASFPNGIPNPLLPENRDVTAEAVRMSGADLGLAWDGDFDRCFFFDETGSFVDGEYVVALLAKAALARDPGATIVHDPRVVWATTETVLAAGGVPTVSKTGHAFVKQRMRETGAAYGGEMSAHHYYRDFYHCDSGMIPAIKMMELVVDAGRSLSALVADLKLRFPSSGEINFAVPDPHAMLDDVVASIGKGANDIDRLDGVSLDFGDWRMNLRPSNTEPLLRLNLETRGDRQLLDAKLGEICRLINSISKDVGIGE